MRTPWMVVGLGNPGTRYSGNRHNVGAMVVAELLRRWGGSMRLHKSRCRTDSVALTDAEGRPHKVVLAVPTTFMNESGHPVAALAGFFGITAERIVVVHDDLDIPFDVVRLKQGGGAGGHNGLRSVSAALSSPDYVRVRVGVGRPPGRTDPAQFVLSDFSTTERKTLPLLIGEAADATQRVVTEGLLAAQQLVHAP